MTLLTFLVIIETDYFLSQGFSHDILTVPSPVYELLLWHDVLTPRIEECCPQI
jgi:hypothetical protein